MSILQPHATLTRLAARQCEQPGKGSKVGGSRRRVSSCTDECGLGKAHLLLEALATGDTSDLDTVVATDVRCRTPSFRSVGLPALCRCIGEPAEGFSQVLVTLGCVGCSGDFMAVEWEVEARHTGVVVAGWAELEPTGRVVTVEGVLLGDLSQGLLSRFSVYHDEVSLLEQLGLL